MTTLTGIISSFQKPEIIDDSHEKKTDSWPKVVLEQIKDARYSCHKKEIRDFERLIHSNKAQINAKVFPLASTIFHMLAKLNRPIEFVSVLAKNGIDFSVQDRSKNTALLWAIANGCNDMAKEILSQLPESQKESLNLHSWHDNTVLHVIVGKGYKDETADGASISCSNSQLLALAISKGADVNAVNEHGNTPLHLAYARRDDEMIQMLIEHGAKQDCLNKEGMKPKEMIYLGKTPEESYAKAKQLMDRTVAAYILKESDFADKEKLEAILKI